MFILSREEIQPLIWILKTPTILGNSLFHSQLKYLVINTLSVLENEISLKNLIDEQGIDILLQLSAQPKPLTSFLPLDLAPSCVLQEALYRVQERFHNFSPLENEKQMNREFIPCFPFDCSEYLPTALAERPLHKMMDETHCKLQFKKE